MSCALEGHVSFQAAAFFNTLVFLEFMLAQQHTQLPICISLFTFKAKIDYIDNI